MTTIQRSFLTKLARSPHQPHQNMGDLTTDPMGVRSPPEVATPGVNPNPIMEVMVTTEVHHPLQANRGITRCQQRLHPRGHPEPEVPEVSIPCSILSANILIRQCSSIRICDHLTVSFYIFTQHFNLSNIFNIVSERKFSSLYCLKIFCENPAA